MLAEKSDSHSGFVVPSKQLHRLMKIVSLLKQGNRSGDQLLRELNKVLSRGRNAVPCSERTLRHDLEILRKEYSCPIHYSRAANQYQLTEGDWSFAIPSIMDKNGLLALVIGGKFSQDILPLQLAQGVTEAVDDVIRCSDTEGFPSWQRLKSLKILTHAGEPVQNKIFLQVFEGWRNCHRMLITYKSNSGRMSSRVIEPHALVFYDLQWGIRAFCPEFNEWRSFLVGRIDSVYEQEEKFVPNEAVIESISADNYYRFTNAGPVWIRLTREGVRYAEAHPLRSTQKIYAGDKADTFTLYVPEISVEEMIRWVLSQLTVDAVPIGPPKMVDAYRHELQERLALCH